MIEVVLFHIVFYFWPSLHLISAIPSVWYKRNAARAKCCHDLCEYYGRSILSYVTKFVPQWWRYHPSQQVSCSHSSHRPGLVFRARGWFDTSPLATITSPHYYWTFVVYIGKNMRYRYPQPSSLSLFATVLVQYFLGNHTGPVFIHSEKTANCFECQWFSSPVLAK